MRRLVTLLPAACVLLVAAAPARAELLFESSRCDQGGIRFYGPGGPVEGTCRLGIFRMADDGSGQRRLTNSLGPGEKEEEKPSMDFAPAWSPTGAEVVFARQEQNGDSMRLFLVGASGDGQRRLIPNPGTLRQERDPAWSPRGTHIAFAGYQDNPGGQPPFSGIFSVRADGSDLRRVSEAGRGADYPVFMPDGRLVYYERATPGPRWPQGPGFPYLPPDRGWVATDVEGGEAVPLTFGEVEPPIKPEAFSADGRYVAGESLDPFDGRVWLMRLDTGRLWSASNAEPNAGRVTDRSPVFSTQGPALFYFESLSDDPGFKRVALDPGAVPTTVARIGAVSLDWNALGGVVSARPADVAPPAVTLGQRLPGAVRRKVTATQSSDRSRLPFFAIDYSGIVRLDAAVGLRVGKRCRFLGNKGFGRVTLCSLPRYRRIRTLSDWVARTKSLPAGKYEVRFRGTDGRGNTVAAPVRQVVRLR